MATKVLGNTPFWGMVIYEVTGDGTLHGDWKNNGQSNHDSILNEIARKNDNDPKIDGIYTIAWIEEDNQPHTGTLTVRQIQNDTALSFIWEENGTEVFRGMGMPIGLRRIAVTYWDDPNGLRLFF